MVHVIDDIAFDRAMEPFFQLLTCEQLRQISTLTVDQWIEQEVAELVVKAQAGELTDRERSEYEGYVRANNLVAVIRGLANRRLQAERP